MNDAPTAAPGLMDRLDHGSVICAEGYLFELERRGYLQAGAFVPEVLTDHPEVVEQLHRDFVHAGSDVTQALTYYVHREKLRLIGREDDLESMNRIALDIARRVARDTGTLLAGDICNTTLYDPSDSAALAEVDRIFAEEIGWAVDAGADYIVAETFEWGGEALRALAAIKRHSSLPAVVTIPIIREEHTREGWTAAEACKRLEDAGADVVGLNCHRGPATMLPLLETDPSGGQMPCGGPAGALSHHPRRAVFHGADRCLLWRSARVSGGFGSVRLHPRGDRRFHPGGARDGD